MPVFIFFFLIVSGFVLLMIISYKKDQSLIAINTNTASITVEGLARVTDKTLIEETRMITLLPPTFKTVHFLSVEFQINHKTYKEECSLKDAAHITVGETITVINNGQKWCLSK